MEEKSFRQQLKRDGCEDVSTVEWEPNTVNETHTHDFSASLLVLAGEMTVTMEDGTTTCGAGDTFRLAAGIPHAEAVGAEGVRFLVGRT